MKTILILIALLAILSFSAYAGCCVIETSPNSVYWDFGSWSSSEKFCNNLGTFLNLNSFWYSEDCDTSNTAMIPPGSIDGWSSPTPIITLSGGGGGGGGGGSTPTCEQIGYVCNDWSECVNEEQTRDCTKRMICGNFPTSQIIKETRSCTPLLLKGETATEVTSSPPETGTTEGNVAGEGADTEAGIGDITGAAVTDLKEEGAFSKITGAVTGTVLRSPVMYVIIFAIIIGGLFVLTYFFNLKRKPKRSEG